MMWVEINCGAEDARRGRRRSVGAGRVSRKGSSVRTGMCRGRRSASRVRARRSAKRG